MLVLLNPRDLNHVRGESCESVDEVEYHAQQAIYYIKEVGGYTSLVIPSTFPNYDAN